MYIKGDSESSVSSMQLEVPGNRGNGDLSRISRFNIISDFEHMSSRGMSLKNLVTSLSMDYLKSIENRGTSTDFVIVVRQVGSSLTVRVIWDRLRGEYLSRSCPSVRSHQVYLPEEVWSRGARARQLFVLGNILLKIYEPMIGEIEGLELYRELESRGVYGKVNIENVIEVAYYPFIFSCLSFNFARSVSVQDPHVELGSALQKAAVGGALITAACFSAPFVLGAMGFGAAGIIKASGAAFWQSCFGAGPAFATLQSLGATGCAGLQTAGFASGAAVAGTAGATQVLSNLPSTSYGYLHNSDSNDPDKWGKLVACKNVRYNEY